MSMKKNTHWDPLGPVVIGGVGGSGTRVVAEILINMGFDLGQVDSKRLDNIWFSRLFFLPYRWYSKNRAVTKPLQMNKTISTFGTLMSSEPLPYFKRLKIRLMAFAYLSRVWMHYHAPRTEWELIPEALKFFKESIAPPARRRSRIGWGWKEPISFFYLRHLNVHFPRMKYIHVIRHGIDMAYSHNDLQFKCWSQFFNIPAGKRRRLYRRARMRYWIRANQRALFQARKYLRDRFLIVRFEDLCSQPENEISKIMEFLKIPVSDIQTKRLARIVKPPPSIGRHLREDSSVFSDKMMTLLKKLGYPDESI